MGDKGKNQNGEVSEERRKDEDVGAEGDETTDDEGGVDTPPPQDRDEDDEHPDGEGNYEEDTDESKPHKRKPTEEGEVPLSEEEFEGFDSQKAAKAGSRSKKRKVEEKQKEDDQNEVEQIVDMECKRRWKCPVKFRVRWLGYGEKDDTWLPASELSCDDLINEFLEISGRTSEYKNAMAPKKRPDEDEQRIIETRKTIRVSYSELDEDQEEVIPAGTRSRKVKTKAEKKVVRPPPKKKPRVLATSPKGKAQIQSVPQEYEVEAVVDHRVRGRFTEYKVRWKGFGPMDDSWLPEAELNCDNLLNKYFKTAGRNLEESFEVEAIMGLREVKGRTEYKVRWKGWNSKYDSWLAEDELNCPELLKRFKTTLETLEKQEDWQVEKILEEREKKGKKEYLIQWKDWGPKFNTWEPEENLEGCPDIVKRFKDQEKKQKNKEPLKNKTNKRASTKKETKTKHKDENEEEDMEDEEQENEEESNSPNKKKKETIKGKTNKKGSAKKETKKKPTKDEEEVMEEEEQEDVEEDNDTPVKKTKEPLKNKTNKRASTKKDTKTKHKDENEEEDMEDEEQENEEESNSPNKKEKMLKEGRKMREERPSTQRFVDNYSEGSRSRSRRAGKNRSYSEFYDQ
ncbi:ABC transporter F family member 4-like isoform X2 [Procambarus clarkii]|uniref:ABC transporter F family member 4 isoform X2 n=1 Tax=Procambarus clarkii TaxID=6728 RepID=UPI003742EA79